ncbi:FecR domain-containing protein [bacterium]|nr:FecR domain-containing protein [bacterium]
MKRQANAAVRTTLIWVLTVCLALPAAAQEAITITIARIAGTVEVQHPEVTLGEWQGADTGQAIGSGWRLRTGAASKAQLVFPLDNVVILKENSVLFVNSLDLGGGAQLESDQGSLLVNLRNALAPGSEFELETPTALAVVRGTKYGAEDIDGYDVTFYGYEGDTEIYGKEGGMVHLIADTTVDVVVDEAPSEPYDSGPGADAFLADAEDASAFDAAEAAAQAFLAALALLNRSLDGLGAKLGLYEQEWDRYERRDQAAQMVYLYAMVLDLWEKVDEAADDFEALSAEIGDAGIGGVLGVADIVVSIAAKLAALYERLEAIADEAEPLIIDNEDLLESLRGTLPPGDPALGLRWKMFDTDNDGISDVDETALGLDPMVGNDDGFIVLIAPDDGEVVEFPENLELTFEFEELDTDLVTAYHLVIEAGGRQWTRSNASDSEDVDLALLIGEGGVFAGDLSPGGALEAEWFVIAEIDEDELFLNLAALNPGFPPGIGAGLSSERRVITIQGPAQADVVVVDLILAGPATVNLGGTVRIRGVMSEVAAMGQWEIEISYDPTVLDFEGGRRLGMFTGSTVFFGDEAGGIVTVSGIAPRDSAGVSGQGDIFELEFIAADTGVSFVQVDGVALLDILDNAIDAEPSDDVDVEVAGAAQGVAGAYPGDYER